MNMLQDLHLDVLSMDVVTDLSLRLVEEFIGAYLPDDYKEFLKKYGDFGGKSKSGDTQNIRYKRPQNKWNPSAPATAVAVTFKTYNRTNCNIEYTSDSTDDECYCLIVGTQSIF